MGDARAAILDTIRKQLGRAGGVDARTSRRTYEAIPRLYNHLGGLDPQATLSLLLERLTDYDAEVMLLEQADVATAVCDVLRRNGESVLLVSPEVPRSWYPQDTEILCDGSEDQTRLPLATLTRAQAVLTTCAGAIAETGTILLAHGSEQGRRAISLLPDHHLCVVRRDQVVETVSEGWALLADVKSAAITTVSGPSATADIEMTRIRGVHGPRRLTVLLLDPSQQECLEDRAPGRLRDIP